MAKKRALFALMLASTLAGSASAALAAAGSATGPTATSSIVIRHRLEFNGTVTALVFMGDRLINVFRTVRGVGLGTHPTAGAGNHTNGIQDGPDGIDPLGAKDGGIRTDDAPPANPGPPVP